MAQSVRALPILASSIPIVVVASGASGATAAKPALSGRIENLQAAVDLIAYNQNNHVGLSIPGEGRIERSTGITSRWELPIPLYVDASASRAHVTEAMTYCAHRARRGVEGRSRRGSVSRPMSL